MVNFLPQQKTSGQALIILLLIMVVGLTVGLSVATRTATDVRLTSQQESSQKAFSAAEAGIEDVLRRDLSQLSGASLQANVGDSSYVVSIDAQGDGTAFATTISQDDTAQVVLAPATATPPTGLIIYWVNTDPQSGETTTVNSKAASLLVTAIYLDNNGSYVTQKFAVNPNCTTIAENSQDNGFNSVTCSTTNSPPIDGKTYDSSFSFTFSGGSNVPQLVRIRPLYNKTSVVVQASPAGSSLPVQGFLVESTGVSGDIARRIQVFRSIETLPSVFDYVIYSGTDLTK